MIPRGNIENVIAASVPTVTTLQGTESNTDTSIWIFPRICAMADLDFLSLCSVGDW